MSELTAALSDSTVDKVVVAVAGSPYELTGNMDGCDLGSGPSGLCISRAVTVEAEVAGAVVLDGMCDRRVFEVLPSGAANLVGLSITGGCAQVCSRVLGFHCPPTFSSSAPLERFVCLPSA